MATPRICSIPDCGKPEKTRGWCVAHYTRWHRHGDPLVLNRPPNGARRQFFEDVVMKYEGGGCLYWPYAKSGVGYGDIDVKGWSSRLVHRLVCERVHGPAPTHEHEAAHTCGQGVQGCVSPKHISWKTRAENIADKLDHGTTLRGEKHNLAVLTERNVREIRTLCGKIPQSKIAAMFGVTQSQISHINTGKSWGWLDG